jgi:hypothetical protein
MGRRLPQVHGRAGSQRGQSRRTRSTRRRSVFVSCRGAENQGSDLGADSQRPEPPVQQRGTCGCEWPLCASRSMPKGVAAAPLSGVGGMPARPSPQRRRSGGGVRYVDDVELVDRGEVVRVAGVEGSWFATATAAIIASNERAAGFRPVRRSDAATCPNARAAAASKGIGSKSASACWRWACRAARSGSVRATRGLTDSSASVIVEISGSAGRTAASSSPGRRISVLVSIKPRVCRSCGAVKATGPGARRDPAAAFRDRGAEGDASAGAAPQPSRQDAPLDAVPRPACLNVACDVLGVGDRSPPRGAPSRS